MDLEGIAMDREVRRLRDMISARFADSVYNGFWFSPEMEFMLSSIRKSQERVTGEVGVEVFKGHANPVSRESPFSLYDKDLSSMDYEGGYDPTEAAGFIKIVSLAQMFCCLLS